mmetsp:Transcript_18180/g.47786  ORF Transcript_18180/g.47786 Transcript_18180/m.47786 type:complete len:225 (+) Transcript_18180:357-1031(+)
MSSTSSERILCALLKYSLDALPGCAMAGASAGSPASTSFESGGTEMKYKGTVSPTPPLAAAPPGAAPEPPPKLAALPPPPLPPPLPPPFSPPSLFLEGALVESIMEEPSGNMKPLRARMAAAEESGSRKSMKPKPLQEPSSFIMALTPEGAMAPKGPMSLYRSTSVVSAGKFLMYTWHSSGTRPPPRSPAFLTAPKRLKNESGGVGLPPILAPLPPQSPPPLPP